MARNVFLSFLGTTNYKEEKYYINNDPSTALEPMRFAQEAALKHHCKHFTENDAVYIFLTQEARKKNWEDFEHVENFKTKEKIWKKGLKNIFLENNLPFRVYDEDINDGESETEIWDIFQKVYDLLKDGDKVYFDITHGFRSIPMLNMTLINYAKALKGIEVEGIYYGAYEAGNREEKTTPIWDLTSFASLQEWTAAANLFIKYGNSNALSDVVEKQINPLLRKQDEKTQAARDMNSFLKSLKTVTANFQTNRGKEIVKGKTFEILKKNLSAISNNNFIVPMKPLLEKVSAKLGKFSTDEDWRNGFKAVEWCIEHNLVQQGITMLQESIFTYYCFKFELDYTKEEDRTLISDCLYIINKKTADKTDKWKDKTREREKEALIFLPQIPEKLASEYDSLTKAARNDINHGGFSGSPQSSEKLSKKLKDSYECIYSIISELENAE